MTTTSRLPTKSDFPTVQALDIIAPQDSKPPQNILVLLHGLGDTQTSFAALGRQLNLPETGCISLRAPTPIPAFFTGSDGPAFAWSDDVVLDQRTGELDIEGGGFLKAERMLGEIVHGLVTRCGFRRRDVFFLGWGQGGMAALGYLSSVPATEEFSGVVSIGGCIPASTAHPRDGKKRRTPVLVLGGSRSRVLTRSSVAVVKESFGDVQYVKWAKDDDGMMRNREEMLPIMRFLGMRLRSRAGVPEGALEV